MKSALRTALDSAWAQEAAASMAGSAAAAPAWPAPRAVGAAPRSSMQRRRKLWQLAARMHCPIIGTCVSVTELRRLTARHDQLLPGLSDFELHVQVVAACSQRSALTEALQRLLDKRHAAAVCRSLQLKGSAAVLAYWQAARQAGDDIAGALWACLSQAELDEAAWMQIEGDVHMLAHQTGAAVRADLQQLARLQQENQQLRDAQVALRHELLAQQRQLAAAQVALDGSQAQLQTQGVVLVQRERELAEVRAQADEHAALVERAGLLAQQRTQQDMLLREQAQRIEHLLAERALLRSELQASEAALEGLLGVCPASDVSPVAGSAGCERSCQAEAQLAGRCVLCIGGRANLVDGYRRLVETRGGRFMHHDGGQEENLRRLDTALISADAVVCQAGCVSHAAYWRLKEACKKLGKPCVFLKSPGVTSFARGLVDLVGTAVGVAHH